MADKKEPIQKADIQLIRIETHFSKQERFSRTIGILLVNGQFMSNTVEDYDYGLEQKTTTGKSVRAVKKKHPGRVAIPSGVYSVGLSNSTLFGKNAVEVKGVTGFDGIRIHAGATSSFTEGCILVGLSAKATENQLADYDSLPFDPALNRKKDKKGNWQLDKPTKEASKKAGKWNPAWLQTIIDNAGGEATLTISRRYPSKEFLDQLVHQKNNQERLKSLKSYQQQVLQHPNQVHAPEPQIAARLPVNQVANRAGNMHRPLLAHQATNQQFSRSAAGSISPVNSISGRHQNHADNGSPTAHHAAPAQRGTRGRRG